MEYFTIQENFYKGDGFEFAPGIYTGVGYSVEISQPEKVDRGSKNCTTIDFRQQICAQFDTILTAKAFWQLLRSGNVLPAEPLCSKPDLTMANYAKQASLAVGLSTRISELEGTIAMMMNQLKAQSQYIQDYVLTPAK